MENYSHDYNQATTKLAFHSNESSKDKLSIIWNWLSIIVIQVNANLTTQNLVHFYMLITLKHKSSWEVCENQFYGKNTHLLNEHMFRCTLELPLFVPTTYVTEIKETYFDTLNKYHVYWLSSFKHFKLPIIIKIPLFIVYIYMTAISPNLISWNMLFLCSNLRISYKYQLWKHDIGLTLSKIKLNYNFIT